MSDKDLIRRIRALISAEGYYDWVIHDPNITSKGAQQIINMVREHHGLLSKAQWLQLGAEDERNKVKQECKDAVEPALKEIIRLSDYTNFEVNGKELAEKALKAVLLQRGIDFPYTHVVETLLDLLKAAGVDVPSEVDEAVVLTQYAVQTRYPGVWGKVSLLEAQSAIQRARQVLCWAEAELNES